MQKRSPETRCRPSRLIDGLVAERRAREAALTPAERIEATYRLSCDLRRLFWAGMRSQGFSEEEILASWKRRR